MAPPVKPLVAAGTGARLAQGDAVPFAEPKPATDPKRQALQALYPELSYRAACEQAYDDQYLYLASLYPASFPWRSSAAVDRCEAWCKAADREDAERAARGEPPLGEIERAKRGLALRKAGAQLPNYVKTRSA